MTLRALALALFLASAAAASADVVEQWKTKVEESAAALRAGRYERSLKLSESVAREMIERLGPGDGSTRIFGTVVVHKAAALAGLGRQDDALWYWHTALSLDPALAKSDLSMWNEAGRFLMEHADPRKPTIPGPEAERKPLGPQMTPPRLLKRVKPEFPRGARAFGVDGKLVVQVMIGADGKVHSPVILTPLPAPTLSYVALDAVRRWQFEPATNEGKPIEVVFELTVNYKL